MQGIGQHRPHKDLKKRVMAMKAFLKSDLFLRFLGGFAIGAVAMVAFHQEEAPTLAPPAIASTTTHGPASL